MYIAHIRVTAPSRYIGKLNASRGARVFLTLPGMDEIEITGLKSITTRMGVEDAPTVVVEFLATTQIEYLDEEVSAKE